MRALMLGIATALVIGKPLGFCAATGAAVWMGVAAKPQAYSWRQLAGAGALAGIGFTMSLFIASQAFPTETDYAAAKIAIFVGSIVSALIGVAILWGAQPNSNSNPTPTPTPTPISVRAESRVVLNPYCRCHWRCRRRGHCQTRSCSCVRKRTDSRMQISIGLHIASLSLIYSRE